MHSLHCSKTESSNGGRILFLTSLSIFPLEIWPRRQCHNFDDASWALLSTISRVTLCHQLLYQLSSICLWSASELTLYSIEVLGDRVTLWDWAHNCRFNHVLYHSQTFLVGSDPLPMHKNHRTIFWDLKTLSLVAQVASFSFVSLTGAIESVGHGEVTTQFTLNKMKTRSNLFLT